MSAAPRRPSATAAGAAPRPSAPSLAGAWAASLALVACGRGSPSRDLPPAARPIVPEQPAAGLPRPPPARASAAPTPPPPAELPAVPPGDPATPVRAICLVQMDCAGRGRLDRTAFAQVESGRGRSCEDAAAPPRRCQALYLGETDEPGASALCGRIRFDPAPAPSGGRPRQSAQRDLRQLAARPAPCARAPGRIDYQTWCDDYRADGTLSKRTYFAHVAGGGERFHVTEVGEDGKETDGFTDCDSGHH